MAKFSEFMQHSRIAQLLNGQKGSESESQTEVERVGDNASGLEIAHTGITQDEIVAQTGTQELAASSENLGDEREQVSESVWEDALLSRPAHHRPLHRLLPATARIGVLGLVAVAMWWTWPRYDDPNSWFEDARAGDVPSLAVVNPANVEQGGVIARAATLTPDATALAAQFTNIVIVTPTSIAPGASNTDTSDTDTVAAVALEEPIVLEASALVTDADTGAIVIEIPGAAPVGELMPALESEPIAEEQPATQTEIILIPTATPTPTPQTASAVTAASVPKVEIVPAVGLRLTPPAEVATAEPIPTGTPTATPAPIGPGRLWSTFAPLPPSESDHFWIGNPFEGHSGNRFASPSYQFGSTAGNRYRPHHGLDFSNPSGTPVQAAVEGTVVHAGPDDPDVLGPYPDFYGNAVVIRLDQQLPVAGGKLDVFVLYGHLSEVTAEVGQHVGPNDIVGLVGMSGIAIGPHLHVEVRLGANTYDHSVNPYLWLEPTEGNGAVAIRLLTAKGRTWAGAKVSIARFENGRAVWGRQIETYLDTENIGPDPLWGENGAMGDVPAGQYFLIASINGESIRAEFTVNAGETTFVEIRTEQ